MEKKTTGTVVGLTVSAAMVLGLAGCSGGPRDDFMAACTTNTGDEAGCTCIADRLDEKLDEAQFAQLAEFMGAEEGEISQAEAMEVLGSGVMEQFVMSAKQCEANL